MLVFVSVYIGKRDRVRRFGVNFIYYDFEVLVGFGRGYREMRWGEESVDGWCFYYWSFGVFGCNRD